MLCFSFISPNYRNKKLLGGSFLERLLGESRGVRKLEFLVLVLRNLLVKRSRVPLQCAITLLRIRNLKFGDILNQTS